MLTALIRCNKHDNKNDLLNGQHKNKREDNKVSNNSQYVVAPLAASIYSGNLTNMVTRLTGGSYRLEALIGSELYPTHVKNINHALVSTFTTVGQLTGQLW